MKLFRRVLIIYATVCLLHVTFDSTFASAQVDAMDLHQVQIANAPADVAEWPITVGITEVKMGTPDGVSFTTAPALPSNWNYRIPGWDGDLQYTVWPVVRVNGQWHTSGIIQMWQGRASTGAPILSDFHQNWAYATRWGGLYDYQPQVGDQMGFFLTAGNARDERAVTSKRERSNVVLLRLPAGDTGRFAFAAQAPTMGGGENVVAQAKQDLRAAGIQVENKACTDFEIAKLVAGRIPGAGLLTKDCCGDENDNNRSHCLYNGVWYAHDIVAFANGVIVDIAQDGGGANGPTWQVAEPDPGLISRYRSAASLGLFGIVPGTSPAPTPVPTPTPVPVPTPVPAPLQIDYTRLLEQILESQDRLLNAQQDLLVIAKDTNTHVVNIDRTFAQTMGSIGIFVSKYIAPAIGGFIVAKKAN